MKVATLIQYFIFFKIIFKQFVNQNTVTKSVFLPLESIKIVLHVLLKQHRRQSKKYIHVTVRYNKTFPNLIFTPTLSVVDYNSQSQMGLEKSPGRLVTFSLLHSMSKPIELQRSKTWIMVPHASCMLLSAVPGEQQSSPGYGLLQVLWILSVAWEGEKRIIKIN